jgi:hypothetical protein
LDQWNPTKGFTFASCAKKLSWIEFFNSLTRREAY